jgi:hypothetical protein
MRALRIELALLQRKSLDLNLITETFPKSVLWDDNVCPNLDSNLLIPRRGFREHDLRRACIQDAFLSTPE